MLDLCACHVQRAEGGLTWMCVSDAQHLCCGLAHSGFKMLRTRRPPCRSGNANWHPVIFCLWICRIDMISLAI